MTLFFYNEDGFFNIVKEATCVPHKGEYIQSDNCLFIVSTVIMDIDNDFADVYVTKYDYNKIKNEHIQI